MNPLELEGVKILTTVYVVIENVMNLALHFFKVEYVEVYQAHALDLVQTTLHFDIILEQDVVEDPLFIEPMVTQMHGDVHSQG